MNAYAANPDHGFDSAPPHMPVAVQVLSMIFFMAFAIVSTALAFSWFWPAGFALAVIFALRGFGPFGGERHSGRRQRVNMMALRPDVSPTPAQVLTPTGNISFDAYRTDMLDRLESERRTFEDFLGRLRAAKDMSEFDQFMDDRAAKLPGRLNDDEAAV
jgi:hypothetical protein